MNSMYFITSARWIAERDFTCSTSGSKSGGENAFCKLLLGQPVRDPQRKQNFRERHGASPHLRGFARTYRAYRMTSSRSDGASAEISK